MRTVVLTAALIFAASLLLAQSPTAPMQPNESEVQAELQRSRTLLHSGKFQEALAVLQQLREKQPDLVGLDHEFGVAFYRSGDYVSAVASLKRALAVNPSDKEAIQLLGLSYYFSGKAADAIPLLEKVQTWYPMANVDAAYVLGQCYLQTKDYEKARAAFATMYGVPANSAASHLFLARMLLRNELTEVAEGEARKALAVEPRLPLAHFLLGELHMFQSRVPEAINDFEAEMAINPGDSTTYYKLADAYSRVLRFDDAERLLQRSIWLDSTATGPYVLMGKVLLKKGESQLAARTLQHALSMDPNNFMAHHLLGEAFRALGRDSEARQELEIAQKLQASQNGSAQQAQ
jgi:tetratricopeptide (TPR) repeat protein